MSACAHDAELAPPIPVLALLALSVGLHMLLVRVLPTVGPTAAPAPPPLVLTLTPAPAVATEITYTCRFEVRG